MTEDMGFAVLDTATLTLLHLLALKQGRYHLNKRVADDLDPAGVHVVATNVLIDDGDVVRVTMHVKTNAGADYVMLDIPTHYYNRLPRVRRTGRKFEVREKDGAWVEMEGV